VEFVLHGHSAAWLLSPHLTCLLTIRKRVDIRHSEPLCHD
jgi:hypothetical protein